MLSETQIICELGRALFTGAQLCGAKLRNTDTGRFSARGPQGGGGGVKELTWEHKSAQPWGEGGGIPCLLQCLRHPGTCRRSRSSKHLGPMGCPSPPSPLHASHGVSQPTLCATRGTGGLQRASSRS